MWCVSVEESLDQPLSMSRLLTLNELPTNGDPGKNPSSQESKGQDTSDPMHPSRPSHHLALRFGPVLLLGQQPDVRPFKG
ncbi:MAG TPA: hypothetical protein VJY33_00580, partial [Isosphaeraceae bacterium]|nr:hypothetical protein [Isosphaeraceae bacterium]